MAMRLENRVQRGHYFAMVDEVDNVLIDEARTPLIISGPASGDLEWYGRMAQIVKQLKPEDYEMEEKSATINVDRDRYEPRGALLGILARSQPPRRYRTPSRHVAGYFEQSLRAQFLFHRNKDYLVQGGKVVIVDESRGGSCPGDAGAMVASSRGSQRRFEGRARVVTYATVTLQNYFRMYQKLAGMTGTALTEAEEFNKIYKLEVAPISPNLEYQSFGKDAPLTEIKTKDEDGYSYSYFSKAAIPQEPLFFRRKDYPDVIYRTVEAKLRAIVQEIVRFNALGRPLLVGTTSVESSERLSNRLKAEPVRRLMQYMLVRDHYMCQ
jgi:preprotein translocase subunit SecA